MAISVGDRLPEFQFTIMSDDGPAKVSTSELCADKTVVLFAVPGAFTPTCHANHLPGFVEHADAIKEKGVDRIAVTTVNDIHVVQAWQDASKAKGKVMFLSDGNAEFAEAMGQAIDLGVAGMGMRSKRYSVIVKDGEVTHLNVEDNPGEAVVSSASRILEQL